MKRIVSPLRTLKRSAYPTSLSMALPSPCAAGVSLRAQDSGRIGFRQRLPSQQEDGLLGFLDGAIDLVLLQPDGRTQRIAHAPEHPLLVRRTAEQDVARRARVDAHLEEQALQGGRVTADRRR